MGNTLSYRQRPCHKKRRQIGKHPVIPSEAKNRLQARTGNGLKGVSMGAADGCCASM